MGRSDGSVVRSRRDGLILDVRERPPLPLQLIRLPLACSGVRSGVGRRDQVRLESPSRDLEIYTSTTHEKY